MHLKGDVAVREDYVLGVRQNPAGPIVKTFWTGGDIVSICAGIVLSHKTKHGVDQCWTSFGNWNRCRWSRAFMSKLVVGTQFISL